MDVEDMSTSAGGKCWMYCLNGNMDVVAVAGMAVVNMNETFGIVLVLVGLLVVAVGL